MAGYLEKREIGPATLYLGDAREIVPALPKAHLFVSDAPYRLTSGGAAKTSSRHKPMTVGWMADYSNNGAIVHCDIDWDEVAALAFEALVDDADCYLMANDKNVFPAHAAGVRAGFRLHNLLVWGKGTATANRWFMKDCEFTLYLFKGRAKTILTPGAKQLSQIPQRDETGHPTEKPVLEMERYIRASAKPGETVLDPFMGSGSTGVAAVRAGRRFVGVEIERRWFDAACRRIEAAAATPRPRGMFDAFEGEQVEMATGGVA
ncbi:site-specific DNA-methyltransferase [Stappia sp. F7233]|uniref:Methyltransferase n=2 Tax=Stappia albiluteola TaxID=2758565 RepID=A0A839AM24_9HYPH|nr:DNA methyltransferase [Stappia albiluteola]MBA5779479.1 site-specific DNA-methyltransferase [Stappia albiluteola]